jgi:hypothetical protein
LASGLGTTLAKRSKSFLVLFFKKELLSAKYLSQKLALQHPHSYHIPKRPTTKNGAGAKAPAPLSFQKRLSLL